MMCTVPCGHYDFIVILSVAQRLEACLWLNGRGERLSLSLVRMLGVRCPYQLTCSPLTQKPGHTLTKSHMMHRHLQGLP